MFSLKSKQLLVKAAKLSQKKEEKSSKREIRKKIHQIKYLTSRKKVPKITLRKEINRLENQLRSVFLMETELKEKEKKNSKEIAAFKKQIKEMKQKMAAAKDVDLRKKVDKLSHLVGDLAARESAKKEVIFEKKKKKSLEKPDPSLTIKKIDEFQEKIRALKESGKCPPEKIAQLEKRLTDLEKKLPVRVIGSNRVKHKMLFGNVEEITKPHIKKEAKELPLPPPPKKIKKEE